MMKKLQLIIFYSILIILTVSIYFLFTHLKQSNKQIDCGTDELKPFCSSISLNESQTKGKNLFNENCAACHNVIKKSIGPNLIKIDSLIFYNWLNKSLYKQNNSLDNSEFGIKYHQENWGTKLNKKDIKNIIDYCKYFDKD